MGDGFGGERMNLRNNQITMAELLANPAARDVLAREWPMFANMPLKMALNFARATIPPAQIQRILNELTKI